ncbi:MAG: SDR family oxidoreductase, partial [Oscillospiraceae bacterium]|nr:SDR family oxidoreductase [Oscillospiraceae bacterium]
MAEKYVYFNNITDPVASNVAEHIKTLGYTPVTGSFDLTSEDALGAFLEPYKNALTGAVIANPPVIRGTIETTDDDMWIAARESFVVPAFNITQVAGRIFMENKKGSIIYLNSIHAEKPVGDGFLYTMGCAAVQALCREAALIYGGCGVGCYNIMRGIVEGEESYFTGEYSPIYHNSELRFPKERLPP